MIRQSKRLHPPNQEEHLLQLVAEVVDVEEVETAGVAHRTVEEVEWVRGDFNIVGRNFDRTVLIAFFK